MTVKGVGVPVCGQELGDPSDLPAARESTAEGLGFPSYRLTDSILHLCYQQITQRDHMQITKCKTNGFSHEHYGLFRLLTPSKCWARNPSVSFLFRH